MIDEIIERGVAAFLADPRDFIEWKHRQSSEYLAKIEFAERDAPILGLLKQLPELDFAAIVETLGLDTNAASGAAYTIKQPRLSLFGADDALRL
jgi:hypothetical protein